MIEFKYNEAIDIGIKALRYFNIEIKQDMEKLKKQIYEEKSIVDLYLKDITVEKIINLD